MARVALVSLSSVVSDPRVMRQYRALRVEHEVHVVGFGASGPVMSHFTAIDATQPAVFSSVSNAWRLALRRYASYYARHPQIQALERALAKTGSGFDLVVANDVFLLPAVLKWAKGTPVWLDAHEYAPREFEDRWAWRALLGPFFHDVCARYLAQTAAVSTVCQGLADEYSVQYGVCVQVLPNCPDEVALPVQPTQPGVIRLIHHGAAIPSRRIELMIDLMDHLDERFQLDLMLVLQDAAYMDALRKRSANQPRVRFVEPVPMQEIAYRTNAYDIGLFLLPPTNFNYLHALPNKFFEFMQARLAIAIGPSPEMRALVEAYGCGIVSSSFQIEDLASALNRLEVADIDRMKRASDKAAKRFNASATSAAFMAQVAELLATTTMPQVPRAQPQD